MDMGVDAARNGDPAGSVDFAMALVEPLAQRDDPPARDADIALHDVRSRGNRGVADDEIVLGH